MCLYPRLIENPKYKANKKNKGIPPKARDPRVKMVPIGCGNCMECKKQRANGWRTRILEEIRQKPGKGIFVTLTFSDESLVKLERDLRKRGCELEGYELDNEMVKLAVKRWSDRFYKKNKRRPRRWMVTEIGGKYSQRIHLHGIIWEAFTQESLEDIWKYGNVWIGDYVNEATGNYIVKYMTKVDKKHPDYKGIVLTSPGIGKGYFDRMDWKNNVYVPGETREYYRTRKGLKVALPIYYRNKLYTEEEREKLWIEKLDKCERWVNGIKVIVQSDKDLDYFLRVQAQEQEKNRRLGYGSDKVDWKRKLYVKKWRTLQQLERRKRISHKNN